MGDADLVAVLAEEQRSSKQTIVLARGGDILDFE